MRYVFTNCTLDTERCELLRAGHAVSIRPKVLQVLTYLIEHRDRVVPKQELFEQCWPGRVVGDASLNSVLKDARRAVGDSGDKQKILRTLHGHGYHFVATIEQPAADAGRNVTDPGTDAQPEESVKPLSDREHKQVSVLSCSVANAEALAASAGPEAMDELMRQFFAAVRSVLARYEGTATEWSTDGFTALFGAPRSQEDHARRATLAALDLQPRAGPELNLQTGLHTGSVLVGNLSEQNQLYTAIGNTTQVARQIRDRAVGLILASESFYRLLEGEIGARLVDGADDDSPALYRIDRLAEQRSGVPYRTARMRARFVGRQDDLAIIRKRTQLAESGAGQTVCISGEPGIGKSRLLKEVQAELADVAFTCLQANCLAYRSSSPYFPLIQLMRQLFNIGGSDTEEDIARRLDEHFRQADIEDPASRDALLHLLDAANEFQTEEDPVPQTSRDQLFALVTRLIIGASRQQALALAIEDLHWMDATSEQWLSSFVTRIAGAKILLLLTYRPGYRSPWLPHSSVTQLALPRLNDSDSAALVDSLRTIVPGSADATRSIISHAQGNPFFLEELTFNLAEKDDLEAAAVPTTVQAVLASRIDQLQGADKAVLQLAAVIGTPVPRDLLSAVAELDPSDLDRRIDNLEDAEFLFEEYGNSGRVYQFRHALTRDVAYQSLLSSARRECHRTIARCYEERFPELAATRPELVAHHYGEAGLASEALDCWFKAGVRAARRSANPEAVMHFEKALSVSEMLPNSRQLQERQLAIYLRMGPPLMSTKAFTSPAVEQAYQRAKALCESLENDSDLFTVLWGLWLHKAHRGRIDEARALAAKILQLAEELADPEKTLQAHHAVWTTEIWHGELVECKHHALEGIRLYDPVTHRSHKYLYGGHDPGVCARGTAAIAAWFLGYPDEALELTKAGAQLAAELDHPFSLLITHHDFMEVEALRRDPDATLIYANRAIELCREQNVPSYLAVGRIFAGWAKLAGEPNDDGMAQLQRGLQDYRALGAERNLTPYLLLLADILETPDDCSAGLEVVKEAAMLIKRTGEVRWQAEIFRQHGELLLLHSDDNAGQAEKLFEDALGVAADQACKSFELRAAISLAELFKRQSKPGDARKILQPVYEWFTEGFDTGDLQQARALLESLD